LKRKDLGRSPSFKPSGGGATYCSGRFLAQREALVFVTVLLSRFDVGLTPDFGGRVGEELENQPFLKIEQMKPCLGIMGLAKGEDVRVFVGAMEKN
jgi:hypothetical protein